MEKEYSRPLFVCDENSWVAVLAMSGDEARAKRWGIGYPRIVDLAVTGCSSRAASAIPASRRSVVAVSLSRTRSLAEKRGLQRRGTGVALSLRSSP